MSPLTISNRRKNVISDLPDVVMTKVAEFLVFKDVQQTHLVARATLPWKRAVIQVEVRRINAITTLFNVAYASVQALDKDKKYQVMELLVAPPAQGSIENFSRLCSQKHIVEKQFLVNIQVLKNIPKIASLFADAWYSDKTVGWKRMEKMFESMRAADFNENDDSRLFFKNLYMEIELKQRKLVSDSLLEDLNKILLLKSKEEVLKFTKDNIDRNPGFSIEYLRNIFKLKEQKKIEDNDIVECFIPEAVPTAKKRCYEFLALLNDIGNEVQMDDELLFENIFAFFELEINCTKFIVLAVERIFLYFKGRLKEDFIFKNLAGLILKLYEKFRTFDFFHNLFTVLPFEEFSRIFKFFLEFRFRLSKEQSEKVLQKIKNFSPSDWNGRLLTLIGETQTFSKRF